ncbi:ABC transporter ATP-binding protein [Ammoniphilus sp. 3BR4]|uniref:ABC transporter ATP-binding protein n=1 Tax=Ammoniphilus sp. 3BR4 TaxID=3158265 RepID=UPI003464F760
MEALVQLVDVSFGYEKGHEEIRILKNHSSAIYPKEFVSLVGLSGCGKSTVLKLVAGLYEPTAGHIEFLGAKGGRRLGKVGLMPQQDLLMPWRTVAANAALPLEIQGIGKKEAQDKVREMLPLFGLGAFAHAYPHELSGGMRQRVSFLRAVLGGHPLLLLDEPFSALDAFTRRELQHWLTEAWQKWEQSVFLITHDIEEALYLSDRIYVMSSQQEGAFKEIRVPFDRPRSPSLIMTKEFVELREKIMNLLYEKRVSL